MQPNSDTLPRAHSDNSHSGVHDFADLLRAVNAIDGVERIRFMSPHPRHMRDRVIDAMADSSKVCRHLHLPLQSGSDRILSAMRRYYSSDDYLKIVEQLRCKMDGLLITTDLIVGFPGESDEDFQATLHFMRTVRFDGIFAFKYSPRPGTSSAELTDDVAAQTKDSRLQQLLALSQDIVRAKGQSARIWTH